MLKILKILGGALSVLALSGVLYINSQRAELYEKILSSAEEIASEKLGVPVKIGDVDLSEVSLLRLKENSDVTLRDVEIFDKRDELIARVDETKINFKLLALTDDPIAALDEIKINGATVNLTKRDDDSWNVNDIKTDSEGESTFDAKIFLQGGNLNAAFDGKNISVTEIAGSADCTPGQADAEVSAKTLGSTVKATGTLGSAQQVINAEVDEIFFDKVMPYLPADKIPEGVKIVGGTARDTTIHLLRRDDKLTYLGSTKVAGARVTVEQTDVEDINGNITFNEREIFLNASATANGQRAAASGSVRLDTDETFFDIHATADSFAPAAILADIGIEGAASIRAHLVGTATNPQVDAEIFSDWLSYGILSAQNVSTKLRYAGEMLYLNDTSAQIFGGNVAATAEIKTDDLSFNANVKANGLDAATLCDFAQTAQLVDGKISCDLGINGIGDDIEQVKIYGNARATALAFGGLDVNEANASFYCKGDDLTIDYLSAKLPNNGTLGLEGTITDTSKLDLDFYGAHVDMTIAKIFNEQLDMSGLTDFKGSVHGNADNPDITLELSAVDRSEDGEHFAGKFFKQPFDSIQLAASGSLGGVNVDKFNLEKDGKLKWTVIEGSVGLTGEKPVNLQLDTTEVRAEDIAALVAPDQPITGNVSNTVKITGTIDAPKVTGNIKFNRGSYHGFLLSGMTGDYFLEGDTLRLQEFQITSPMIDMIVNGTIDKNTHVMDFVVQGKDINLQRFEGKLPENYIAEGHSTFEGLIKGTLEQPIFDGELKSDSILLNGVNLTDVYGHVMMHGYNWYLDEFHFNDGKGSYKVQLSSNIEHETLSGTFVGYDIHDIKVNVRLLDNTVYFNQLEDKQGDNGTFHLLGSANRYGPLDVTFIAKNLELGLFSKAAGYNVDMTGTSNIVAKLNGTVDKPFGEVLWTAAGSIKGATFDLLHGHFLMKGEVVNIEELSVQRELSGKTYSAKITGDVPFKAVMARTKDALPDDEQLNLTVSMDGADLSLLPVVSNKMVSFGVGELDGAVKITGTAAHPQINGKISLNDGSVKLKDMKSLIEHINISTVFRDERFEVENFSGQIGGGTFALTGGLNFSGLELSDYNFDFAAVNLDIDSNIFDGLVNANFNFSESSFMHRNMPKLSGQVNLDKCRVTITSVPDSDEPLPDWLMDVSVNLGDKVHFYSSRLYDLYLTGNARFERSMRNPKTSGTVNVKRGGTLTYLESVFNIREGEAHFNQIGNFMPTLNFLAETKIDRTKIFLTVNGSPDNMQLKLTSSPEMSDTEILRLLTLRQAYTNGKNLSAADALAIGLQMTILSDIEDTLKRKLGIDQLTIARGTGSLFQHYNTAERSGRDDKDYNVTVGKYINEKLMIRYTRGFGSHKLHRYGLQYDFNDNVGLTVEREGKDYIFSIEARFKF